MAALRSVCSLSIMAICFIIVSHQSAGAYMTKDQMVKMMKTVRNMCLSKSGTTTEAIDKMTQGTFDETDHTLKCYLGCVMGMMQAVKNNEINLKMIRIQITKMMEPTMGQRILTAFESCQETVGDDNCDLAFKFAHCVYKADPEMFVVP